LKKGKWLTDWIIIVVIIMIHVILCLATVILTLIDEVCISYLKGVMNLLKYNTFYYIVV